MISTKLKILAPVNKPIALPTETEIRYLNLSRTLTLFMGRRTKIENFGLDGFLHLNRVINLFLK